LIDVPVGRFGIWADPRSGPGDRDAWCAGVSGRCDEAWKIKKPVKFRYMDFSTLDRREQVCRRELDINQPNAPQIYLGVVPVTREADGTLALGGEGEPVEWAVHMRRFPDDALLREQGPRGATGRCAWSSGCARSLPGFMRARLCCAIQALPGVWRTSLAVSMPRSRRHAMCCRTGWCKRLPSSCRCSAEGVDARAKRKREAAGFVRRCHGDLHLANIVVLDGEPVLFDAIEFSEELATIDVLYDVGFLLMDLVHEEQAAAANRVLNGYLRGSQVAGIEGLQALALFLGLRAGVRAMVTLDRAAQREGLRAAGRHRNWRRRSISSRRLTVSHRASPSAGGGWRVFRYRQDDRGGCAGACAAACCRVRCTCALTWSAS
jgi:aminoglycoside phosphotransferase family enzyme